VNLILQGPALEQGHIDEAARMTRATSAERIAPRAYRLKNAFQENALAAWCEAHEIDHAFVPEGRRFADLKLLALDMDSTLITVECIDELGELAGKKREVAAITAQAMRGEIDYTESLRRRVALLQGLEESALGRVYDERLRLTPGAERLLEACKKHRVQLLLVSGGFTFFTERLKARLDIDYTVSNVLGIERGRLTGRVVGDIVEAEAKAAKFRSVARELKARKEQTLAIGDGANDLKMMAEAGFSVAFHAKPVVREHASCALNWSGLDGVVNLFE
jgi:phosphoserine phosphatase